MKAFMIVPIILAAVFLCGYISNVVKFVNCDFSSPYKAELIRGVGVLFPPVGMVAGYVEIEDGNE